MGKGKEVKEDARAFIVGMAKGGATISKILKETKRPRALLRQSWENIDFAETFSKLQNVVVDLQIQRQETITYDMGLHVLWWSWSTRHC